MKKLIDIDDSVVKDLKRLALEDDKDLKKYIQDLLTKHAKTTKVIKNGIRKK